MKTLEKKRRLDATLAIYGINLPEKYSLDFNAEHAVINYSVGCYGKDYRGDMKTWHEPRVIEINLTDLSCTASNGVHHELNAKLLEKHKKTDFSSTVPAEFIRELETLANENFMRANDIYRVNFYAASLSCGRLGLEAQTCCNDGYWDSEFFEYTEKTNAADVLKNLFGNDCFSSKSLLNDDDEKLIQVMSRIFNSKEILI